MLQVICIVSGYGICFLDIINFLIPPSFGTSYAIRCRQDLCQLLGILEVNKHRNRWKDLRIVQNLLLASESITSGALEIFQEPGWTEPASVSPS